LSAPVGSICGIVGIAATRNRLRVGFSAFAALINASYLALIFWAIFVHGIC